MATPHLFMLVVSNDFVFSLVLSLMKDVQLRPIDDVMLDHPFIKQMEQ